MMYGLRAGADFNMPQKTMREPQQIAYLMTHYPRVALTFISGEIDAIERRGRSIVPIALNLPLAADMAADEAVSRQHRTYYLKSSIWQLGTATVGTFLSHPLSMARILSLAVKSARWDLSLMMRRIAHVFYACLTAQLCRANSISHLHAHFGQTPATIAWFACEIFNSTSTKSLTWSFTIHGFQDFVDDAVARLDLKAKSAKFVVCISDFTKSQLCRVTDPQLWDRFHVVRCGIDLNAFPQRTGRSIRKVPRIISVARLSPEKGHLILLHAIKLLQEDGNDVQLQIVGSGPFEHAIQREADLLGIGETVLFTGERLPQEVSILLAEADIFCLPSFSEGLPVSIMEAMAIGVPVVSTWISGIPELATNEETALTVPASNAPALAAVLKRMMNDEKLRDMLVKNARAKVERMHSIENNSDTLFSMFQSVLNEVELRAPSSSISPVI